MIFPCSINRPFVPGEEEKMIKCEKKHANKGYTFVELMIVIAILAVLAGSIGLAVIRYIEKSRIAMDVHNASMIRNALNEYPFPSDFQGRAVTYTDPKTNETETYRRGWVYVDKDEIRCSDQSTALAMIEAGLVHVSPETERKIREHEEDPARWFPSGPDQDYYRRTNIDEYVFKNTLTVKARTTWNTYQLDVYINDAGVINLGASASNTTRTNGHEKDDETAALFAEKVGLDDSLHTPIGEQFRNQY